MIDQPVGVIGLGNMGGSIARNLLNKGVNVLVYDVIEESVQKFVELGATAAGSPQEMAEEAKFIVVIVFDGSQVKEVILGPNGIAKGNRDKNVPTLISCSTIFPQEAIEIGEGTRAQGLDILDVAVSGGPERGAAGTLTMMVAGPQTVFDTCKELLTLMGDKNVYYVGAESGMGQYTKAAHQILVGAVFLGVFEALTFGAKAGLNVEILSEILNSGVAGNLLSQVMSTAILERDFLTHGNVSTMFKDLKIAAHEGKALNVSLPATALASEIFQAGFNNNPDLDVAAVVKIYEMMSGVKVSKSK